MGIHSRYYGALKPSLIKGGIDLKQYRDIVLAGGRRCHALHVHTLLCLGERVIRTQGKISLMNPSSLLCKDEALKLYDRALLLKIPCCEYQIKGL